MPADYNGSYVWLSGLWFMKAYAKIMLSVARYSIIWQQANIAILLEIVTDPL